MGAGLHKGTRAERAAGVRVLRCTMTTRRSTLWCGPSRYA